MSRPTTFKRQFAGALFDCFNISNPYSISNPCNGIPGKVSSDPNIRIGSSVNITSGGWGVSDEVFELIKHIPLTVTGTDHSTDNTMVSFSNETRYLLAVIADLIDCDGGGGSCPLYGALDHRGLRHADNKFVG